MKTHKTKTSVETANFTILCNSNATKNLTLIFGPPTSIEISPLMTSQRPPNAYNRQQHNIARIKICQALNIRIDLKQNKRYFNTTRRAKSNS